MTRTRRGCKQASEKQRNRGNGAVDTAHQQRVRAPGGARLSRVSAAGEAEDPERQSRWRTSAISAAPIRRRRRGLPEIAADPADAARYTARGNLVAVVSNGTAVLGLGNIGALAGKPVMKERRSSSEAGRHRLLRHRGERDRSRQARGDRRGASRAHLRRHQPRGHQGARVFGGRAALPREDEHPRLRRRPARHRDRGRRGDGQRAAGGEKKNIEDIKIVSTGGGAAGIACSTC